MPKIQKNSEQQPHLSSQSEQNDSHHNQNEEESEQDQQQQSSNSSESIFDQFQFPDFKATPIFNKRQTGEEKNNNTDVDMNQLNMDSSQQIRRRNLTFGKESEFQLKQQQIQSNIENNIQANPVSTNPNIKEQGQVYSGKKVLTKNKGRRSKTNYSQPIFLPYSSLIPDQLSFQPSKKNNKPMLKVKTNSVLELKHKNRTLSKFMNKSNKIMEQKEQQRRKGTRHYTSLYMNKGNQASKEKNTEDKWVNKLLKEVEKENETENKDEKCERMGRRCRSINEIVTPPISPNDKVFFTFNNKKGGLKGPQPNIQTRKLIGNAKQLEKQKKLLRIKQLQTRSQSYFYKKQQSLLASPRSPREETNQNYTNTTINSRVRPPSVTRSRSNQGSNNNIIANKFSKETVKQKFYNGGQRQSQFANKKGMKFTKTAHKNSFFDQPKSKHQKNPYAITIKNAQEKIVPVQTQGKIEDNLQISYDSQLMKVDYLKVDPIELYQIKNSVSQEQFKRVQPVSSSVGATPSFNYSSHFIVSKGDIKIKERYYQGDDEIKEKSSNKSYLSGVDGSGCSCSQENSAYYLAQSHQHVCTGDYCKYTTKGREIQPTRKPMSIASIAHLQNEDIQNKERSVHNIVVVDQVNTETRKHAQTSLAIPQSYNDVSSIISKGLVEFLQNDQISGNMLFNSISSNPTRTIMQRTALTPKLRWRRFKNQIENMSFAFYIWQKVQHQHLKYEDYRKKRNVYNALCTNLRINNSKHEDQFGQPNIFFIENTSKEGKNRSEMKKQKINIKFDIVIDYTIYDEQNSTNKVILKRTVDAIYQLNRDFGTKKASSKNLDKMGIISGNKIEMEGSSSPDSTFPKFKSKSKELNVFEKSIDISSNNMIMHFELGTQQNSEELNDKLIASCNSFKIEEFLKYLGNFLKLLSIVNVKNGKRIQLGSIKSKGIFDNKHSRVKEKKMKQSRQGGKDKRVRICHDHVIKHSKQKQQSQLNNNASSLIHNNSKCSQNLNIGQQKSRARQSYTQNESKIYLKSVDNHWNSYLDRSFKYVNCCYGYYYTQKQYLFAPDAHFETHEKVSQNFQSIQSHGNESISICNTQNKGSYESKLGEHHEIIQFLLKQPAEQNKSPDRIMEISDTQKESDQIDSYNESTSKQDNENFILPRSIAKHNKQQMRLVNSLELERKEIAHRKKHVSLGMTERLVGKQGLGLQLTQNKEQKKQFLVGFDYDSDESYRTHKKSVHQNQTKIPSCFHQIKQSLIGVLKLENIHFQLNEMPLSQNYKFIREYGKSYNKIHFDRDEKMMKKHFKYRGFAEIHKKYFLFSFKCELVNQKEPTEKRRAGSEEENKVKISIEIIHELLNQTANLPMLEKQENRHPKQKMYTAKILQMRNQTQLTKSHSGQYDKEQLVDLYTDFNNKKKLIVEEFLQQMEIRKLLNIQAEWTYEMLQKYSAQNFQNLLNSIKQEKQLQILPNWIINYIQVQRNRGINKVRKNFPHALADQLGQKLISQLVFGIYKEENEDQNKKIFSLKYCQEEQSRRDCKNRIKIIECEESKSVFVTYTDDVIINEKKMKQDNRKLYRAMIKFDSMNEYMDVQTGDKIKVKNTKRMNQSSRDVFTYEKSRYKRESSQRENASSSLSKTNQKKEQSIDKQCMNQSCNLSEEIINLKSLSSKGIRKGSIGYINEIQVHKPNLTEYFLPSSRFFPANDSQKVKNEAYPFFEFKKDRRKFISDYEKKEKTYWIPRESRQISEESDVMSMTLPQKQVAKWNTIQSKFSSTNPLFNKMSPRNESHRIESNIGLYKNGTDNKKPLKVTKFLEQSQYSINLNKHYIYGNLRGNKFYRKLFKEELTKLINSSSSHYPNNGLFYQMQQQFIKCQLHLENINNHQFCIYLDPPPEEEKGQIEVLCKKQVSVGKIMLETEQRISGFQIENKHKQDKVNKIEADKREALLIKCQYRFKQNENPFILTKNAKYLNLMNIRYIIKPLKSSRSYYVDVPIHTIKEHSDLQADESQKNKKNPSNKSQREVPQQDLKLCQLQNYAKKLKKYPSLLFYSYRVTPPIYKIFYRKTKKLCTGMFVIFTIVYVQSIGYGFVKVYINWLQKCFYFKFSTERFKEIQSDPESLKLWEDIIEIYTQRLKNIYFKRKVDGVLEQLKQKNLKLYHLMMCKNGMDSYNTNNYRALRQTRGAKIRRYKPNSNKKTQTSNILDDEEIIMYQEIAQKYFTDSFGRSFFILFYARCSEPKNILNSNSRISEALSENQPEDALQSTKNTIKVQIFQLNKFTKLLFEWNFHHKTRNSQMQSGIRNLQQNGIKNLQQLKDGKQSLKTQILAKLLKSSLISPMRMYKTLLKKVSQRIKNQPYNSQQNLVSTLKQLFQTNKLQDCNKNIFAFLFKKKSQTFYNIYKHFSKGKWVLVYEQSTKIKSNKQQNKKKKITPHKYQMKCSNKNYKKIIIEKELSQTRREIQVPSMGFQNCVPLHMYNKRLCKRLAKILSFGRQVF